MSCENGCSLADYPSTVFYHVSPTDKVYNNLTQSPLLRLGQYQYLKLNNAPARRRGYEEATPTFLTSRKFLLHTELSPPFLTWELPGSSDARYFVD
jgi:hypothetical protein